MADHAYVTHTGCQQPHCAICDGGLGICSVCGGCEGSLPTECPGVRMAAIVETAVYDGLIDFREGRWVRGPCLAWSHRPQLLTFAERALQNQALLATRGLTMVA